jgi:hypothetical protein
VRPTVLLALPWLSLLCGCHALIRDAEVIDYRPGGTAATTVAKFDASYRLSAPGVRRSWIETDVLQGNAVGFRQERDGTVVAFAGEQTWRVEASDGRHVWLCTPRPVTAWDQFLVRTRDTSENTFSKAVMILTAPFWITQCAVTGVWP